MKKLEREKKKKERTRILIPVEMDRLDLRSETSQKTWRRGQGRENKRGGKSLKVSRREAYYLSNK
jgi:hypothetical protein